MINIAHLLGRVGAKTVKEMPDGTKICNISLVTNKTYLDRMGQKKDEDTWHNINLFNKVGDIAVKYAHVGGLIHITGEIQNKKSFDKEGKERWFYSVIAREIKLLPNPKREDKPEVNGNVAPKEFDDGIPF